MDGDGGECGLLVVGLLAVVGVELSWVMMMAGDCWAGGLGNSVGAMFNGPVEGAELVSGAGLADC